MPELRPAVTAWLNAEPTVQSAVLFGSSARPAEAAGSGDPWSDVDLHIITKAPAALEKIDWRRALPRQDFYLQVARPATGGMRKVTAVFAAGQVDLVLVPAMTMRLTRLAMSAGLHRRVPFLRIALDEMATTLGAGYRFLKGERAWGSFYRRVAAEMRGVRLDDGEAINLANVFLCELLWVLQKLERGELLAAQLALHRSLAEANFRLVRELRQRRGPPLPSFGLARRVELLLSAEELDCLRISARAERKELRGAAWKALAGLKTLMGELVPAWRVPPGIDRLLAPHAEP